MINNEILARKMPEKTLLTSQIVEKDRQNLMLLNFLVGDILDFSRLSSEEFKPNFSYFRFEQILNQMSGLFKD